MNKMNIESYARWINSGNVSDKNWLMKQYPIATYMKYVLPYELNIYPDWRCNQ
jgi:hypothetical protein